jgi:hypothetical protein
MNARLERKLRLLSGIVAAGVIAGIAFTAAMDRSLSGCVCSRAAAMIGPIASPDIVEAASIDQGAIIPDEVATTPHFLVWDNYFARGPRFAPEPI